MNVIIDTGPVVALLNDRDAYHDFIDKKMRELEPPFYTCEAVVTESFFLLHRIPNGIEKLMALLVRDKIRISFQYKNHLDAVHKTMQKYSDLPASFADACLVQMAETMSEARIFTVDFDFEIYRTKAGGALSLISPD